MRCFNYPAKATSKEAADKMKAANTEIVNAHDHQTWG
jgi:cellobiose-specific phosphotransferase system component IIA